MQSTVKLSGDIRVVDYNMDRVICPVNNSSTRPEARDHPTNASCQGLEILLAYELCAHLLSTSSTGTTGSYVSRPNLFRRTLPLDLNIPFSLSNPHDSNLFLLPRGSYLLEPPVHILELKKGSVTLRSLQKVRPQMRNIQFV